MLLQVGERYIYIYIYNIRIKVTKNWHIFVDMSSRKMLISQMFVRGVLFSQKMVAKYQKIVVK